MRDGVRLRTAGLPFATDNGTGVFIVTGDGKSIAL
jgi:hypothetical protein